MNGLAESPAKLSGDSSFLSISTEPRHSPQTSISPVKPTRTPTLNARSCHTCRRRKVKCDKTSPCVNCTKSHTECIFPGPGRAPRRSKAPKGTTERETELLKRLRRLEGVVEELSGQVEGETGAKPSPTGSKKDESNSYNTSPNTGSKTNDIQVRVLGMDEGTNKRQWLTRLYGLGEGPPKSDNILAKDMAKLVIEEGKSRYVGSDFWARLCVEVEDVREMIDETEDDVTDDDEPTPDPLSGAPEGDHQSFILGYSSANVDLFPLHPLPSQIPFFWDIYIENVDPLCKFIHVPTMSKTIKQVRQSPHSLSPSTQALMFAIYFAAVTSLTEEEVISNFGVERQYLLARYRFGTEQALAKAGFLNTSEIVTLQAFVLFLVCVRRHDDSRSIWSLVGLAIRLGQSLGLHRDGHALGLSPFDTELRRRIWWQIVVLDLRASEDFGSDPTIMEYSFDTKLPLNLNDSDLDPTTVELPASRQGVSEMTFCLIRYEICTLTRRLNYTPPAGPCHLKQETTLADKEEMIKDLHDHLEVMYLNSCENSGPLFWVAATVSRLILSKMSLVIYGFPAPGNENDLPKHIRDRLFIASIETLEYTHILETEVSTKKWGWLFHTYTQWHAIAYVLRELGVQSPSALVDRAWNAVNGVFENWGETVRNTCKNGMLWVTMRKLMLKARRKRQADANAAVQSFQAVPTETSPKKIIFPPQQNSLAHVFTTEDMAILNSDVPAQVNFPYQGWAATSSQNVQIQGIPPNVPNHIPLPPNQQPQQQPQQQYMPLSQSQTNGQPLAWPLDDPAFADIDMNGVDGEINWEGWDDVVKSFAMEMDQGVADAGAPNINNMGAWW